MRESPCGHRVDRDRAQQHEIRRRGWVGEKGRVERLGGIHRLRAATRSLWRTSSNLALREVPAFARFTAMGAICQAHQDTSAASALVIWVEAMTGAHLDA